MIDSQSPRVVETVRAAGRGYDAGKRVNGTKRHIAVDTLGLLLAVAVTATRVIATCPNANPASPSSTTVPPS